MFPTTQVMTAVRAKIPVPIQTPVRGASCAVEVEGPGISFLIFIK